MKRLVALTTAGVALLSATLLAASAQAPAAERFVVTGVLILDDGDGWAWLQEPSLTNNESVRVRRGHTVGQWRLTRLLEDRVELEGPGGRITYVILAGARAPAAVSEFAAGQQAGASPRTSVQDDVAAQARAAARSLATGGDEGVWDDDGASPSVAPPASPSVAPPRP